MNLMNIALSGLNANQAALDATAQNVANVNTPGYSRQQATMNAVSSGSLDRYSAGGGVEVTSIRRVSDQYLVRQTWATNSDAAYSSRYMENMSQLENMLGADGFSISAGLDTFYAALNDASIKPESTPLRQQIITEAEALSRRFNTLTTSLHEQHQALSDQRDATLKQANSLLSNIAGVNAQLVELSGTTGNPAQLQDSRDKLIGELSQLVDIQSNEQPDGSLQLTLASGQPLVIGGEAATLSAIPAVDDAYSAQLHVTFAEQDFPINSNVGGGLGAISDYQQEAIKPYQHALNEMAAALADAVNTTLATGQDLNGQPGQPLFRYESGNPAASLDITGLSPEQLAFSADGTPGNSEVLTQLIGIGNQPFAITGLGNVSLNDAFGAMVGETAIKSRQAETDYTAQQSLSQQAIAARDNLSAVNSDEEAANLMSFANAYQANMKVISTANQLFDTVLKTF